MHLRRALMKSDLSAISPPPSPFTHTLMQQIRDRFFYADADPISGPRIFLENGGGSLVLRAAVERRAALQALPDSASRRNDSAARLRETVALGTQHLRQFFGVESGHIVYGATGTELLFRIVRAALERAPQGSVVSSSLEHTSSHDAALNWAAAFGHEHIDIAFDPETVLVTPEQYGRAVRPDTVLATVIHTSHVSGTRVDLPGICAAIRAVAPRCFIVCDGIQHAPHGPVTAETDGVDAYVYAPYKAFSPRGAAYAWVSERLANVPRNDTHGKAPTNWSLGSSDPSMYAAISAVHEYLLWVGEQVAHPADPPHSPAMAVQAAMRAINDHERSLIHRLIHGAPGLTGLAGIPGVRLVGGLDTSTREGALSFALPGHKAMDLTDRFAERGIRVHYRTGGAGSSARFVLDPLGMADALRISLCHFNTEAEMDAVLKALAEIA